ncbi:MAG: hypothetical protein ABJE47_01960 [bacterium]
MRPSFRLIALVLALGVAACSAVTEPVTSRTATPAGIARDDITPSDTGVCRNGYNGSQGHSCT